MFSTRILGRRASYGCPTRLDAACVGPVKSSDVKGGFRATDRGTRFRQMGASAVVAATVTAVGAGGRSGLSPRPGVDRLREATRRLERPAHRGFGRTTRVSGEPRADAGATKWGVGGHRTRASIALAVTSVSKRLA